MFRCAKSGKKKTKWYLGVCDIFVEGFHAADLAAQ